MSRRAARMEAVEVLYASDVRDASAPEVLEERKTESDLAPYAVRLVTEIHRRRNELDTAIAAKSARWPVNRMSAVDRNILRVGALELLEGDVPPAVAIDEAVEIAKAMSGEEAGRFVNGVLAAIHSELQASEAGRSSSS